MGILDSGRGKSPQEIAGINTNYGRVTVVMRIDPFQIRSKYNLIYYYIGHKHNNHGDL